MKGMGQRRTFSFWALLLAVIVLGTAGFFFYRTPARIQAPAPDASFGGVSLNLDYATTTEMQERGLGGRAVVSDKYGMLFIFKESQRYGFWMKDMQVPIDIFWLDDKGQVISVLENVAPSTYPSVFYAPRPVHLVLETRAGFAHDYRIATSTKLVLKNPPDILK